jgi:hypothetical protein
VVAELKLTADQRDRIRTIEDEALFAWMRRPPGAPGNPGQAAASDRIDAVLTAEQVRRWRAMTGAALKSPIAPFAPPPVR